MMIKYEYTTLFETKSVQITASNQVINNYFLIDYLTCVKSLFLL